MYAQSQPKCTYTEGQCYNVNTQQQTTQQQFVNSAPLNQFQQASYSTMPLQQTSYTTLPTTTHQIHPESNQQRFQHTNNSAPSTLNTENNSQNESETITKYTWQTIKKRKRSHETTETTTGNNTPIYFNTQNRYEELSQLSDEDMTTNDINKIADNTKHTKPRVPKPPPVYIYGVTNYREMVEYLASTIEEEQYYCKALSNETIKINVTTAESYRKLIRQLQQDKVVHHTYQIREERAYRVVLRNLHHSIPTEEIKQELEKQGHTVRNILNVRHRKTKEPLPLYFIDLEPKPSNKNIYDIQYLCNMKITVEAPRKKNTIVQCTRCQCYGHTKSYCARPYACVKCGGDHNTILCKKHPNTPATCALCGGNHPANYKGCDIYINLQKARNKTTYEPRRKITQTHTANININDNNQFPILNPDQPPIQTPINQHTSYSQILKQNQQSLDITEQLTAFLNEFKAMFNQLINQNSMVLNMLTTLINKIAH